MLAVLVLVAAAGRGKEGAPQAPDAPKGLRPAGWLVFTDSSYRFEVAYPPAFAVVPENLPTTGSLKRIRFQDREILATPLGQLEPARLTIEVFPATATSLGDWLQSTGRLRAGAIVTRMPLAGASEGVRVQLQQQLAPNEFYYFSTNTYVYRLVPLGSHSAEMLASFRLF
jgi:hypothetical protein